MGIARNFGRSVDSYDQCARVQKTMAHRLLGRIRQTVANRVSRIIEIGCGTGYFTQLLAEAFPQAEIIAIDICHQAVAAAQSRLRHCSRLEFLVADGELLDEPDCDLLVSNATFQWFDNVCDAFVRYHSCLRLGGQLLFATLGKGTFAELYVSLNKTVGDKEHAIGESYSRHFPCPNVIASGLAAARFSQICVREQRKTEWYDSVRDFLYVVKRVGAGNPRPMALTPRSLAKMISFYSDHFGDQGKIRATYNVIYGQGMKLCESRSVIPDSF
jgi:malonyl-CoA O-methyltransferase